MPPIVQSLNGNVSDWRLCALPKMTLSSHKLMRGDVCHPKEVWLKILYTSSTCWESTGDSSELFMTIFRNSVAKLEQLMFKRKSWWKGAMTRTVMVVRVRNVTQS